MKGIIFDMDGVLFDTEAIWQRCWVAEGKRHGIDLGMDFRREVGGSNGEHMRAVTRRYFHCEDVEEIIANVYSSVHECLEKGVPEKPGLHEILEHARSMGYRMAIASASPYETIIRNLAESGVTDYFDVILSSENVSKGKPDPEVFLTAARLLDIPNKECYVFEDAINGVLAGYRSCSKVIMAVDLVEPDEDIRKLCYAVCHSLEEAIPFLKPAE
jgi:HAD superfamily hydrolase (TIGR01509 family)